MNPDTTSKGPTVDETCLFTPVLTEEYSEEINQLWNKASASFPCRMHTSGGAGKPLSSLEHRGKRLPGFSEDNPQIHCTDVHFLLTHAPLYPRYPNSLPNINSNEVCPLESWTPSPASVSHHAVIRVLIPNLWVVFNSSLEQDP